MNDIEESAGPPRVIIIFPEQWERALLRAALREVGYDAIGARGIRDLRQIPPIASDRGRVMLIVVDQAALVGAAMPAFDTLFERYDNPTVILLARATVDAPAGPWSRVLRRPVDVDRIVSSVQTLLPLPQGARRPVDPS